MLIYLYNYNYFIRIILYYTLIKKLKNAKVINYLTKPFNKRTIKNR